MERKREPDVIISVKGGVADLVRKRPEILVEIRDYDTEGCVPDEMESASVDEEGHSYFQTGWFK
jgi:hypothetical protein